MNPHKLYIPALVLLLLALSVFAVLLWHNGSVAAALRQAAEDRNAVLEKKNADLNIQVKAAKDDATQAHIDGDAARAEIDKWKKKPPTVVTVNEHAPSEGPAKSVETCTDSSGKTEQKVCDQGSVDEALRKEQDANAGRATCEANFKECARKIVDAAKVDTAQAEEIANLRAEKRNLQVALAGGTKWSRTKKELKCGAFGGLGAGVGAAMPKQKSLWAAAGAVVGELGCHVFSK